MAERAANLVDDVLPAAPLRHWVLSMPHPLRAALAYDRALVGRVSGLWASTLVRAYERWARDLQRVRGQGGAVLVIQRTQSDCKLNPHIQTAAFDGVFVPDNGEQNARFVACEQLGESFLAGCLSGCLNRAQDVAFRPA